MTDFLRSIIFLRSFPPFSVIHVGFFRTPSTSPDRFGLRCFLFCVFSPPFPARKGGTLDEQLKEKKIHVTELFIRNGVLLRSLSEWHAFWFSKFVVFFSSSFLFLKSSSLRKKEKKARKSPSVNASRVRKLPNFSSRPYQRKHGVDCNLFAYLSVHNFVLREHRIFSLFWAFNYVLNFALSVTYAVKR